MLDSTQLNIAGSGYTHYRYRLNDGPWSEETTIDTSLDLANLTDGSYRVNVIGKNSAGVWQEETQATVSREWTVNAALEQIRINEVLAFNSNFLGAGDSHPDLIELYNAGASTVVLAGMSLTNDPAEPTRFVFPAGTELPPLPSAGGAGVRIPAAAEYR